MIFSLHCQRKSTFTQGLCAKFIHPKIIHSKSEEVCGFYLPVSKKLRKGRKSRRQHFATKVRKSIKSVRIASFKNKMSKQIKKGVFMTRTMDGYV